MNMFSDETESRRWLHFLSRWASAVVLMGIALLAVYMGGIGFAPSDNALGAEYSELLQAVRAPTAYRLFTTLDALSWLMMGIALLVVAVIVRERAPIRAAIIAACGIGMLTGSLGGFMRLVGFGDLAAHYAGANPAQQVALLQSTLALYEVVGAHFVAGDILAGAGYLLVASVALTHALFPRLLAAWFAVAGILSIVQGATSALGAFSFPVLLLTVVLGILGLHAAIAIAFWRPSPVPADRTAGAQVAG